VDDLRRSEAQKPGPLSPVPGNGQRAATVQAKGPQAHVFLDSLPLASSSAQPGLHVQEPLEPGSWPVVGGAEQGDRFGSLPDALVGGVLRPLEK